MTSKSTSTYNRLNWEESEFAILCETCLGVNPFIRMTKEKYGRECKICNRPFTVFRWCPGRGMRFKTTQICQTCSKMKNVCQTCIFDLNYGLPVEVRDTAMKIKDDAPREGVNREYYTQNMRNELSVSQAGQPLSQFDPTNADQNPMLKRMSRTEPYYKRNLPHLCSFWIKGACKRGEECPYRHEKPSDPDDPLSVQNIKDRYYGSNDPVAQKILSQYNSLPSIVAPEDKTITTIYIGNVNKAVHERDLRSYFYQFGEIRSIIMAYKHNCSFVNFTTRRAAELAINSCSTGVVIKGILLNLNWSKSVGVKTDDESNYPIVPGLPDASNFVPSKTIQINPNPHIAPPPPKYPKNDEDSKNGNYVPPPPSKEKSVDIRDIDQSVTISQILQSLRIFKYKPPISYSINFKNLLEQVDKNLIFQIIGWALENINDLKRRAYLGKYLVKIDVPVEYRHDIIMSDLLQQVISNSSKLMQTRPIPAYNVCIENFKISHKNRETMKSSELNTGELKYDIVEMEKEKEQLSRRVERIKTKASSIQNLDLIIPAAKKYRNEYERHQTLKMEELQQRQIIRHLESKLNRLEKNLVDAQQNSLAATESG
ncbi:Pre-mRNA-splicing factor SLT11 [Intoshia linei]|uniref:Pre-mRNA-splicing factor SLT11 n=1 Tax=Intoshia linei TaxID=1819745 RepID=A0A177AZ22_9BILA|nr:Pre-mRNA-splicing factor SLT11 [Intoshia linei]